MEANIRFQQSESHLIYSEVTVLLVQNFLCVPLERCIWTTVEGHRHKERILYNTVCNFWKYEFCCRLRLLKTHITFYYYYIRTVDLSPITYNGSALWRDLLIHMKNRRNDYSSHSFELYSARSSLIYSVWLYVHPCSFLILPFPPVESPHLLWPHLFLIPSLAPLYNYQSFSTLCQTVFVP